jgi:hypothetical protein
MRDECLQGVERVLLPQPRDHLGGKIARLVRLIAGTNRVFARCRLRRVLPAPIPGIGDGALDAAGAATVGDRAWRHFRRHHANEIVRTDDLVQRVDDRLARAIRTRHLHRPLVEEQREQARGVRAC